MPVPRRSVRAGGIAMKTSLTVLVLVLLLLSILAGCAPGPNPSRKMASEHGEFAGFWLGLWQGFIAPFVCSWPRYLRATSMSMRSTTMDPGTTSAIYSAWPVSSEGAATGHHGGAVRATLARAQNRRLNPLTRKYQETGLSPSSSKLSANLTLGLLLAYPSSRIKPKST